MKEVWEKLHLSLINFIQVAVSPNGSTAQFQVEIRNIFSARKMMSIRRKKGGGVR